MTYANEWAATGTPAPADGHQDVVTGALGALGDPVDVGTARSLSLEGPHVLWLVVAGAMDVFAVDAEEMGHWHFLGRLEPGTLLLGPVEGPRHTLAGRPLQDCALRRIPLRELFPPEQGGPADPYAAQYTADPYAGQYTNPWGYPALQQQLGPLEDAFARGVGRGLRVLFEGPLDGRPGQGAAPDDADEDILWMSVAPGSVQYGAAYDAGATDLLIGGAMWQHMVNQQSRMLFSLDRWIARLERAHEDRTAAGIDAGEAAQADADQTLLASINKPGRPGRSGRPVPNATAARDRDDATLAVCRLVARAAGTPLPETVHTGPGDDRLAPVERIASGARLRTRVVRLADGWWKQDCGPLVGHRTGSSAPVALLWRRGRYEAHDPATGERRRVGSANQVRFERRAVMFYRPLPEEPVRPRRLLRFALFGTGKDMRHLVLASLVAVGLGALVPLATGQVLGVYVPNAENSLIVQASVAVMAATLVSAAFLLLQNTSILRLEGRLEATLQPAVWDRLLRLPTRFFSDRSTGELASAAMGVSHIRRVISGIAPVVVHAVTLGLVNLVLLLCFSVTMALVAVGMLVLITAVFLGTGLWQLRWQRRLVKLHNKLNNQAFQTLRGLPKLRVAAAESFAYAAWAGEFARSREMQRKAGGIRNMSIVFSSVYLPLSMLLLFMLLAGPARGSLSPAGFLTFTSAVTMLLTSVTQLTGALVSAASVLPMFEQLEPILSERPEVRGGSAQPGALTGAVEARDLTFRYTDDGPLVLDGVSFQVRAGRVRRDRRSQRLRQVDAAAPAHRLRQAHLRRGPLRRTGPVRPRPVGRPPPVRGRAAELPALHRVHPGVHLRR